LLPISLQDGLFCEALSPILRRTIPCLGISPMETITHPTLVQLVAAGAEAAGFIVASRQR